MSLMILAVIASPAFAQGIFDQQADWEGRGSAKVAGAVDFTDGVYTMEGNGDDIWDNQDEGFFLYTEKSGSWRLSGKVTWLDNDSHDWSKIGVMIREDGAAVDSAHYWIELRGAEMGDRTDAQWRPTAGAGSSNIEVQTPEGEAVSDLDGSGVYLRVSRQADANKVFSEYSYDGVNWVLAHEQSDREMPDTVAYGLAITNHQDNDGVATAIVEDVVLEPLPKMPGAGIFNMEADWAGRGDFKAPGSASVTDGVYTMSGNGDDIWEEQDEGFFIYTELAGSWSLSGKVKWVDNDSHDWSKIGVMIREQGDAIDSAHYWIDLRGAEMGDRTDAQWRPSTGAASSNQEITTEAGEAVNDKGDGVYLRVSRLHEENKVYTEYSYDGVNWVLAHEQEQEMGEVVAYGLAITNHTDNENVAVATVSDVKLEAIDISGLGPDWVIGTDAGVWKVRDGVLSAYADTGNDPKHAWVNLDMSATDGNYTVKCDARMVNWEDGDLPRAGISVRVNPDDNGANPGSDRALNLLFHDDTNSIDILNDLVSWGERTDIPWEIGTWYTMALTADGNLLDAFFIEQGADVFADGYLSTWEDDRNSNRSPGFPGLAASTWEGLEVQFDNFEVIVDGNVIFSDDFDTAVVDVAGWSLY